MFPSTDIHGREEPVANTRREAITQKEHGTVAKTVSSLRYKVIQTGGEYLMPSAEHGGWPPEDLWAE